MQKKQVKEKANYNIIYKIFQRGAFCLSLTLMLPNPNLVPLWCWIISEIFSYFVGSTAEGTNSLFVHKGVSTFCRATHDLCIPGVNLSRTSNAAESTSHERGSISLPLASSQASPYLTKYWSIGKSGIELHRSAAHITFDVLAVASWPTAKLMSLHDINPVTLIIRV